MFDIGVLNLDDLISSYNKDWGIQEKEDYMTRILTIMMDFRITYKVYNKIKQFISDDMAIIDAIKNKLLVLSKDSDDNTYIYCLNEPAWAFDIHYLRELEADKIKTLM